MIKKNWKYEKEYQYSKNVKEANKAMDFFTNYCLIDAISKVKKNNT